MKKSSHGLADYLRQAKKIRLPAPAKPQLHSFDEPPLRSELFSAEQMALHGKRLAAGHQLSPEYPQDQLLARLAENESLLIAVRDKLTAAVKANQQITPASEWLLDNFYLVEEQIRTAKRHLPKGYSRELPRLANGASAGLPRVYDIALETIAHGDGRVDPDNLTRFVSAYQSVHALKLGELWAIPIMLRLALIENLRRVAVRIAAGRADRDVASHWAEQMRTVAEQDPKSLVLVIADMARSQPPLTTPFISEFTRRLQGQNLALALPLTWIEQVLSESGLTIEQMVQHGNQHQAADQVSVSNSISSLRALSAMDWREFVETLSVVEHILRLDPAGAYARMDFATRDRYRHAVERIAKHGKAVEEAVARHAVQLAQTAAQAVSDARAAHVGFYLVDAGVNQLEANIGAAPCAAILPAMRHARRALQTYLGGIAALTVLLAAGVIAAAQMSGLSPAYLAFVTFWSLLAASQVALSLVNRFAPLWVPPHALPRMDFSAGIPTDARTLVVVPSLLTHAEAIETLVEALEVRFLANRDEHLFFALLTDFTDAPSETMAQDVALVAQAREGIAALNQKYPCASGSRFFLLHRARRWNPQEQCWMGYERKRGKLADLDAYLRGDMATPLGPRFAEIEGDSASLQGVRYVITLDSDTQLPRDAARQLVGAMAHPLNRARRESPAACVHQGYGILQPRVSPSLSGTNRSRYARLYGGEPGLDPYTRAISDVYQDIFGEGSFIGKGIYEIDSFEAALRDRLPENRILSHDLLEGVYARAGLISDVELYEDYPAQYAMDVNRRQRWIRGDWQLLAWLMPRVPLPGRKYEKNPLSWLAQWKLFDNLRRSLVPAALSALLLVGWIVSAAPRLWTLLVIAVLLVPLAVAVLLDLLQKPAEASWRRHVAAVTERASQQLAQAAFTLACLPYETYFSLDAIVRTLWRSAISRKHLLEWHSSSEAARTTRSDFAASLRRMWIAPLSALCVAAILSGLHATALASAAPVLLLWLSAPVLAWWISLPVSRPRAALNLMQLAFLRKLSRQTWRFFVHFVNAEENWLPPDNFQEHPAPVIAHRTSPTNIGLALLANVAAYDFGYACAGEILTRTRNTVATLAKLERHRGHFYNWYDTLTLKPLHPLYISSVDSGNLAGHLLVLRPALLALADAPLICAQWFEGLRDSLQLLRDSHKAAVPAAVLALEQHLDSAAVAANSLAQLAQILTQLRDAAQHIHAELGAQLVTGPQSEGGEGSAHIWAEVLLQQCQAAHAEVTAFAPWAFSSAATDWPNLSRLPTLRELANQADSDAAAASAATQTQAYVHTTQCARLRMAEIDALVEQISGYAEMDYGFLYDEKRHLLAIGYNVDDMRRDTSHYDLLASEARLANFVAIAQTQLPQESWFALGRQLTTAGGDPILLSWSGSMFEYLMPLLVMPTFENTLLDQTYAAAVARQIEYGRQRGVPWGMSESGYNTTDVHLNYQYRAFGVPGLGLKRGLAEDLVIAPYASALALMVAPEAACGNLQRLAKEGLLAGFGFYEAVDYTATRLPRGQSSAVIRSFMAHHQGMSLLALAYLLLDQPMQRRFASDPLFQATMLLLQERIPKGPAYPAQSVELAENRATPAIAEMPVRVLTQPNSALPEVQLLSNGRYHVMVTHAGGGYSRWKDLAVTRWREDATTDAWGSFCYLRDVASGACWSTAYQPTRKQPQHYEAIFSEGRAEFRRRDFDFETHTEIVVSPEDDIELRRVRISNRARHTRSIVVTSYAEVVLAAAAADALHPAFSNLFVQTEIIAPRHAVLCTRRPRSQSEHPPWMLHLMVVHGGVAQEASYETDRARFIGRGRSSANPQAVNSAGSLSGAQGSVLDPIVAVRYVVTLEPGETATVDMVTGVGETRELALSLVEKYQDRRLADRVFELAWTHAQVVLRQLNASEADAQLYARLANSVVYANASLRADPHVLMQNRRGQSGLWGYAISGDLPIVLLKIGDAANIDLVRQMVQAHAYWRLKGLAVDLVIWNEDHAGYRQLLQEQIMGLIVARAETHTMDRPGGIFLRPVDQISNEDRILLQAVARAIISDQRGSLAEQVNQRGLRETRVPRLQATRQHYPESAVAPAPRELILQNGLGGFTPDGKEYVISSSAEQVTPAPWVNILANPNFGSVVSESGMAYTWCENAHEFRLTPWHNDPVSDASGEAFYVRDEETGHFWSPTPLPARGTGVYITRHGFGYSVFEHHEGGVYTELQMYVALDAAVKFSVLKIRNLSGRVRKLSALGYVEWVLGDLRPKSAMHLVTEIDADSGALFARNPYNNEFADRVAFFDVDQIARTVSGDRAEVIGRNGHLSAPAALARANLSGRVGAGLDACGAIQLMLELAPGAETEVIFRLGLAGRRGAEDARKLLHRYRGSDAAREALDHVQQHWARTLGTVQVATPDAALNVLSNGWLLYQTLACRVWARSGYYQSGGAYGFRDQLQDVMALIYADPQRVREQILLSAAHQFVEGDVQHWWHPPSSRGVRTHCSDDYLWLPLATCRYVLGTGDHSILNETVPFLEGRPVNPEDDSYYDLPGRSSEVASLYEHCVRALRHGLRFGAHGLPLIGSGDWNDGMNLVGLQGKGESVWLAFFLCDVLLRFAPLARAHGDAIMAEECLSQARQLRERIEAGAWDGDWYRRAYFDDGTPLGSAANSECRIDSISQSWSILSLAAAPDATISQRSRMGMDAVYRHLVRADHGLIQLLDPPFDKSDMDPGYIKGYVPGVRENGGQYTHAAIWTVMAFAALGDSHRAWELLDMINPIHHAQTAHDAARYKVEPYVVAADVYAVEPHTGRGGWSWYTGSAGWMYRLILESLLGLRLEGDQLHFLPCVPASWDTYALQLRYHDTVYRIAVSQSSAARSEALSLRLDGLPCAGSVVKLENDGQDHSIEIELGQADASAQARA